MKKALWIGGVLVAATLAMTSCSKRTPGTEQAGAGQAGYGAAQAQGYGADGIDAGGYQVAQCALASQPSGYDNMPVYFDFDKSNINSGYYPGLNRIAQMAIQNPGMNIRIDGNTDDRGSREYNVALGWRRANSVATALKQYGVSASQITTVSYGAERPIAFGTSPQDYQCNRRVDVIYQVQ